MKSVAVSAELPDYLKTSFSPSRPEEAKRQSQKTFKPGLRTGVSEESPDFFRVSYARVLSDELKDQERVGNDYSPHLMLSSLKKNRLRAKSTIQNMDMDSAMNFHSIGLSHAVDLLANKAPRLREEASFTLGYKGKQLEEGFGLGRGTCTYESDQLTVPRNYRDKLTFLKRLPFPKIHHKKPNLINLKPQKFLSLSPIREAKPKHANTLRLPNINPMDEFDAKVKNRFVTQYDLRNMYAF